MCSVSQYGVNGVVLESTDPLATSGAGFIARAIVHAMVSTHSLEPSESMDLDVSIFNF